MVTMKGRRMASRSRLRTGSLTNADGSMDADVNPEEPGSEPVAGDGDTGGGISIELGLLL